MKSDKRYSWQDQDQDQESIAIITSFESLERLCHKKSTAFCYELYLWSWFGIANKINLLKF
jgi:hypothetical protein